MSADARSWLDRIWFAWDGDDAVVLGCDPAGAPGRADSGGRAASMAVFAVGAGTGWQDGILLDTFSRPEQHGWTSLLVKPANCDHLVLVQCGSEPPVECARVNFTKSPMREGRLLFAMKWLGGSASDARDLIRFEARRLPRANSLPVLQRLASAEYLPVWAVEAPYVVKPGPGIPDIDVAPFVQVLPVRSPAIEVTPEPFQNRTQQRPSIEDDLPSVVRMIHSRRLANVSLLLTLPTGHGGLREVTSGIAVALALQQRTIPKTVQDMEPELAIAPLERHEVEEWTGYTDFQTPNDTEVVYSANLPACLEGRDRGAHTISVGPMAGATREVGQRRARLIFHGAGRGDLLILLDTLGQDRLSHAATSAQPVSLLAFRIGRQQLEPVSMLVNDPRLDRTWDAGAGEFDAEGRAPMHADPAGANSFTDWMRSNSFGGTAGQLFDAMRNPAAGLTPLMLKAFEEALQSADHRSSLAWGEGTLPRFSQFLTDPATVRFLVARPSLAGSLDAVRDSAQGKIQELSREPRHLAYRVAAALGVAGRYEQSLDGASQVSALLSLTEREGDTAKLMAQARVRFGAAGVSLDQLRTDLLPCLIEAAAEPRRNRFIDTLEDDDKLTEAGQVRGYVARHQRGQDTTLAEAVAVARFVQHARHIIIEEQKVLPDVDASGLASPDDDRTADELRSELALLVEQASRVGPDRVRAKAAAYARQARNPRTTRHFLRSAIADLRAVLKQPATAEIVGRILDGLEAWAGLPGLTANGAASQANDNAYETRTRAVVTLIERANISLDDRTRKRGGQLVNKSEEIVASIAQRLNQFSEADALDPKLRDDLAAYVHVLVHHKTYGVIRRSLEDEAQSSENPQNAQERARLQRRLRLWPRQADTAWEQFLRWKRASGGTDDFPPPRFD